MREVFNIQCGRVPAGSMLSAPCGNGLLAPSADRLQQLVRPGSIHDAYLVEHVPFARGQFASVRKCTHKVTGKRFAAKVLRKRRRLADVYHEIAILDAFADCNRIVHLHEVYETNTEVIIVLELATGGEMQTLLDVEEFIREADAIRLMRQILEGLHQLHDNNIAHLDIKPQNLLLTGPFPNCDVKLCDFGISRHIGSGGELREIMGTADYMAPEILNYEPLSLATDMWSIGVLTYALLTGYAPFTGATVQETYCNITSQEVDFPDELFGDVSETAKDFITGLLVKTPSGRRTLHNCLEHRWLSLCRPTSGAPPPAALPTTHTSGALDDLATTHAHRADQKDSGFSSPACSDDETSLPYSSLPAAPLIDNGNVAPKRRGARLDSSTVTGAYTIENSLPAEPRSPSLPPPKQPPPPEQQQRVDNAPAAAQVELTPLAPLPPIGSRLARVGAAHEDEVSDATSEASSDRTSDMSWEETEFCYRRLSVAQLTDRVWDCFNEHDFASEHVRPWEHVCTGAVGRARAAFQQKSAAPRLARAPASPAVLARVTLRRP